MTETEKLRDLTAGVPLGELRDGAIVSGRVGDDEVLVVERHGKNFAVGSKCTHYHGPLAEGLVVGDTIRCPWHHACFSLVTGEAIGAPALDPVSCWRVDRDEERVYVREKLRTTPQRRSADHRPAWPASVVIVGGGAAGLAAADMLRREGYDAPITMLSADPSPPVDRPNLSKDYLAGQAQPDWLPLRQDDFYRDQRIDLVPGAAAVSIDVRNRTIALANGATRPFGALLIATGAEPIRLNVPGSDLPHVRYLRTWADSDAIIGRLAAAKRVAVVGASFIGLEVAASLRARDVDVHVIAPDALPMARVLGPEIGRWVQHVHESHGVVFHLGREVSRIEPHCVALSDATTLDADMVVIGIGVRPRLELAEQAGLALDRGLSVNEYLETSIPGIFAAGDIARWPDPHSGSRIRVEHWVVAERQGQSAARNILGAREPFQAVPFFWSQHYDTPINYIGHADAWDRIEVDGYLEAQDASVSYHRDGRRLALATVGRDRQSLEVEAEMEHAIASTR